MKCRRIISGKNRYWNIKGWGHFVARICGKCLTFYPIGEGHLPRNAAPLRYRSEKVVRRG
jgi:hypothetical protein